MDSLLRQFYLMKESRFDFREDMLAYYGGMALPLGADIATFPKEVKAYLLI